MSLLFAALALFCFHVWLIKLFPRPNRQESLGGAGARCFAFALPSFMPFLFCLGLIPVFAMLLVLVPACLFFRFLLPIRCVAKRLLERRVVCERKGHKLRGSELWFRKGKGMWVCLFFAALEYALNGFGSLRVSRPQQPTPRFGAWGEPWHLFVWFNWSVFLGSTSFLEHDPKKTMKCTSPTEVNLVDVE